MTPVTLSVMGGRLQGQEFVFTHRESCLVGRGLDCRIRLPAGDEFRAVSRHHCRLDVDPPHVHVRDCGSRNGTSINGMQIGRPAAWHIPPDLAATPCVDYELHNGDVVQVGPAVFQVKVPGEGLRPLE